MPLQARLDAFKAVFEAGEPPYSVPRVPGGSLAVTSSGWRRNRHRSAGLGYRATSHRLRCFWHPIARAG
jgi:hypothetical protein